MLYIFHVDTGRMMTFDMKLALESVQFLKDTIERHHNIPATSQVLLVSGGEMLQLNVRVCTYSAGTDTNPIFMFSTNLIESQNPPKPWPSIDSDTDLKGKIEQCLELPANYNTVVIRAQLAQQCYELAKEETKICEQLVHEQHLQQQGWAAVVANMEDITVDFRERCDDFYRSFDQHIERRQEYLDFVSHFSNDLDNLAKIPILPGLMRCAEEKPFHAFDDYLNDNESFTKSEVLVEGSQQQPSQNMSRVNSREPTPDSSANQSAADLTERKMKNLSLLQWISASENQKSLRHLAHNCQKGLQLFDENTMANLKLNARKAIDSAQQDNIKEIKGLEDRLCGLEKLMFDARKIVQEQCELAQAFQQNQIRANNLGDASILPDLCASHCSQLIVMSKNHKLLRDIRRRVTKAKEELATNLNSRLKYVVYIENLMYEIDNNLLFYHRCLRRLQRHLNIIEQIHKAPCMYVTAVTEVVRRRVFSSAFLMWASNLACQLLTIYNEEVMRRNDFSSLFEGHFLTTLFPGMNDMPPTYATEAPSIFDSSLPPLTKDDISLLSNHLPEIISKIQLPDLGAVIEFFSSRSGTLKSQEDEEKSPIFDTRQCDVDSERLIPKPIDIHPHLKDYERGFESETDTEEFEKVCQSPIEKIRRLSNSGRLSGIGGGGVMPTSDTISGATQTSLFATMAAVHRPETCNTSTSMETVTTHSIETLTEDNLGSTRLEVEKLRNLFKILYKLSQDSIVSLRQQLADLRTTTMAEKNYLKSQILNLSNAVRLIEKEAKQHERELIHRMTLDHELELNDIRKCLMSKDEDIESLRSEKHNLEISQLEVVEQYENSNAKLRQTIETLQTRLKETETKIMNATNDKERAVCEVRDKLIHEHKTEMESLRCRFKLMTSMERSPSDTSLEKIERPEFIELSNHESILLQTKEDMAVEKELAIRSAIERERARFESRNSTAMFMSTSPKSPTTSQDLYKRILEEKDRQIDELHKREVMLTKENQRFKETIQSIADSEPCDEISMLKNQFDDLTRDKVRLEQELEMERSRRVEMERSVTAVRSESHHVSESSRPRTRRSTSQTTLARTSIAVDSCAKGDHVLVVWSAEHERYTVLQDSPIVYFLHGDSYDMLNLSSSPPEGGLPKVIHCLGVVVEKEYCQARKDGNRYRVIKGTKFYRVKVNPLKVDGCSSGNVSGGNGNGGCNTKNRKDRSENVLPSSSSESVSRSTSTEQCTNQQFHFIDSCAQTEMLLDPVIEDATTTSQQGMDMIDSGVVTQQKSIYKDRNESVTEVDEDHMLDDRCRYVSVSEEEEIVSDDVSRNEEDDDGSRLSETCSSSIHNHLLSNLMHATKLFVDPGIDDDSDEYRSLETID